VAALCRGWQYLTLFFFQAEDGIRDFHVTGVQTCALPIFPQRLPFPLRRGKLRWGERLLERVDFVHAWARQRHRLLQHQPSLGVRSEERRVGKECRERWRPEQLKTKNNGYRGGSRADRRTR